MKTQLDARDLDIISDCLGNAIKEELEPDYKRKLIATQNKVLDIIAESAVEEPATNK